MHISEGVLSAPVLICGAALALGGMAKGLRAVGEDDIPKAAVLAAVFFVASLIHVNIGPGSAHLILSGLIGLFLGWAAFPVIFAGLLLQGILFQFGGLTVLGVNTFNMAFPAMALGLLLRKGINSQRKAAAFAAAFICGGGSILLSSLLVALALFLTGREFKFVALEIMLANLPIMIIEGLMCALVVGFLAKVRPALLTGEALGFEKPAKA
ncbi:MAG: cobalt transporter CbiM [Candidatus Adiutrix sp.]|jgi:cobalt/nickel transport system permease protein|nr:cobalt transporter CbiM [Candidatus Adiutrix sp.]